tara:strand:+ start:35743 stop:35901 length:159 start_codon:yes stop_codon:yes gene_type:complete
MAESMQDLLINIRNELEKIRILAEKYDKKERMGEVACSDDSVKKRVVKRNKT